MTRISLILTFSATLLLSDMHLQAEIEGVVAFWKLDEGNGKLVKDWFLLAKITRNSLKWQITMTWTAWKP